MPEVMQPPKDFTLVPTSHVAAEALPVVPYSEAANYRQFPDANVPGISDARNVYKLAQERDHLELNALRQTPDPRLPVAAHRQELANMAAERKSGFVKAHEAALKAVEKQIGENEQHISAMGGFKANPNAAEIRSVIRDMKPQEREALIGQSVEKLDETMLACVFGVPPMLLGVSREFIDAQFNYYLQKIVPDYLKLREQLSATKERMEKTKPLIEAMYDNLGKGIEEFSDAIAKAEAVRNSKH